MEPRRSISSVTSSTSLSKRTGTSNSNPAVMVKPEEGAVSKLTRPVLWSTDQPPVCGTPYRAIWTVPATGLVIARVQSCPPEA